MSKGLLKLKRRNASTGGGGGGSSTFFVTGAGGGEGAYVTKAPVLTVRTGDRQLYRTLLVNTGEDQINLQGEIAKPYSSSVTTWSVESADANDDAQYFESLSNGTFQAKSGLRASMTRRVYKLLVGSSSTLGGTGDKVAVDINYVPDANCRFISWSATNNTPNGQTPATAKKRMPGSYGSSDATVWTDPIVVFMKSEDHRTAHDAGNSRSLPSPLPHHGNSTGDKTCLVVSLCGWGAGRARMNGSDVLTGGTAVTQVEVNGNPNWANIIKFDLTTQGGAAEFGQNFFEDKNGNEDQIFPAVFPKPGAVDYEALIDTVTATPGQELYGLINIPCAFSGTSYICTNDTAATGNPAASGTTVTIKSALIAARYGNVSVANLPPFRFYGPGNNVSFAPATSYDYANSTVVLTMPRGGTTTLGVHGTTGKSAFGVLYAKEDIQLPGQFALSPDGTTAYLWPRDATAAFSIARRLRAVVWGAGDYVTYTGGEYRRYTGTDWPERALDYTQYVAAVGGQAFYCYAGSNNYHRCHIIDAWITQCRAPGGEGVIHLNGSGTNGIADTNIERFRIKDCSGASGIRLSGMYNGCMTQPDAATLAAYPYGKIRDGCVLANGLGRTFVYFDHSEGIHVTLNVERGVVTIHGNAFSPYNQGAWTSVWNRYLLFDRNLIDGSARAYTTNTDGSTDRHITVIDNVFLNVNGQGPTMALYGDDPGCTIKWNIMLGRYSDYSETVTANIYRLKGTFSNNVVAGIACYPTDGSWTGTISNNLDTLNGIASVANSTAGGVKTGNTGLTGGSQIKYWDPETAMPAAVQAALVGRSVGPFREWANLT